MSKKDTKVYDNKKYQYICFTNNNYTEEHVDNLKKLYDDKLINHVQYLVFGFEWGEENNTPHLQGYIEFSVRKRGKYIKNLLIHCNCERRIGRSFDAADYCKKGEQSSKEFKLEGIEGPNYGHNAIFEEFGEISVSRQGERTDIQSAVNNILSGSIQPHEFLSTNADFYHKYKRTLIDAQDRVFLSKNRESEGITTKCRWYFSESNLGKNHQTNLFIKNNNFSFYLWNKKEEFQCRYEQQDVVLINEYRGDGKISYQDLLDFVDKWDTLKIARKGKDAIPFCSKWVIITSPLPPWKIFNRQKYKDDSLIQLLRRIEVWTNPHHHLRTDDPRDVTTEIQNNWFQLSYKECITSMDENDSSDIYNLSDIKPIQSYSNFL